MAFVRLKSIVRLIFVGLLTINPAHAQAADTRDSEEGCSYRRMRIFQDLSAALKAHAKWVEMGGLDKPELISAKPNFCNTNLVGASLKGAVLTGANLEEANLEGADLQEANLKFANLDSANLKGANLAETNLEGATLWGANLEGADLFKANLKGSSFGRANLKGAVLRNVNLKGANLRGANLEGANLIEANLEGANLVEANLKRAFLARSNLEGATLWGANLEGADLRANLEMVDLSKANLQAVDLSGANLKGATLVEADLKGAILKQTVLEDAKLSSADLSGAQYQPATAPAQGYLSGLSGLRLIEFCPGQGSGLVQLRTALKTAGLRDLEREVTYTLESNRTRHALQRWNPAGDETALCAPPQRDRTAAIEGALRLVFFEWTTGYGLSYGRPFVILLGLIGVFTLVYLPPIVITPKRPDNDGGIYRIWPEGRIKRSGETFEAATDISIERLNTRGIAALWQALYFSVVSAFHIGWRDLNVGSWIARMQPREYHLRAKGWVRAVSGVQSIISVYLIAMWVLTYFGRPFE